MIDIENLAGGSAAGPTAVGPALSAYRSAVAVRDDDHAVELANATTFGLGASVWGTTEHALAVGRRDPGAAVLDRQHMALHTSSELAGMFTKTSWRP